MATGVIRNVLLQSPAPHYFPMIFPLSPYKDDVEERLEVIEEKIEDEEDREEEEEEGEEDEDGTSEAQEEEEECLEEVFIRPASYSQDVTKQLLRFADVISRDVQRYFGRPDDQDACDIYSDSISVTTSGRLRYYDDLLRIAKSGSSDDQENSSVADGHKVRVAKGNSGLGPLAELFDRGGPTQSQSRPMIKRHLPLSFWTEPIPCCSLINLTHDPNNDTHSEDSVNTNTNMLYNPLPNPITHTQVLENTQPDFSDLLANWDPNPELPHTLTENTHMHPEHN